MNKVMLTCPFTGVGFKAEISNSVLICTNPLTGNEMMISLNDYQNLEIPYDWFTPLHTVTLSQAAKILNVSRQRVSAIASKNVIPSKTVNNQTVFLLSDVIEYKSNRKPGAPRKA